MPISHKHTSLLDHISTGLLVVDGSGCISYLNSAAEIMLQVSAARTLGVPLTQLFTDDGTNNESIRDIYEALESRRPFTKRETHLNLSSGHSIVVDCAVTPFQPADYGDVAVIVELQPIDRWLRISREEGIISAQQSTRALLRGLAHEIKNPLGGLRGAAQLLDRDLSDDSQRDYTRIIIEEADRLRGLVDRMLGPRRELQPSSINIHEVLEYVRQLLSAEPGVGERLKRDYDPSIPELMGDREQLIQAVLNVVRNALQAGEAMTPPSSITLRTRAVSQFSIGVHSYRLVVRVDVIDSGPGVPEDLAQSLFFPMVSGRAEGTGLGLSIAQSILNQHRGLIEFTSEPGNTVFSFYIPLEDHHD